MAVPFRKTQTQYPLENPRQYLLGNRKALKENVKEGPFTKTERQYPLRTREGSTL